MELQYTKEKERATSYGQGHLFRFWKQLTKEEKKCLIANSEKIDYEFISKLYSNCCQNLKEKEELDGLEKPDSVSKYPYNSEHSKAIAIGEKAIINGKFALFIVAGGQGSRLGFNGPKGLYPATPIMHKSLFVVFAEKILAAQKKYGIKLEWYIMTSDDNNAATIEFFEKNGYFDLDKTKVHFFIQVGSLPAVDKTGKILMKSKYEVFFSPCGTVGIYASLAESGMLDDMRNKGIEYLSFFNVDNPLVNIVDLLFLGYHIMHESEFSAKVIARRNPKEPIGVMVKSGRKHRILEYVNIPKSVAELKDELGELHFKAGSINILLLNVNYIEKIYHQGLIDFNVAALKKVPFVDENGDIVIPQTPNAYKFEGFVFDTLPHANKSLAFEIVREEEFAPIKNATGEDSPNVTYKMQSDLFKTWLLYAGISSDIVNKLKNIEISALFAIDKDEFKEKISRNIKEYEKKLVNIEEFYFG